jgi:hypothetical protein
MRRDAAVAARTRPLALALAGRDHRHFLPRGDGVQAASRVVDPIATDAFEGFFSSNLLQQFGHHRRFSDGIAGRLDGAYLQRLRVDGQVNLVAFTPVLGAMLPALAISFAEKRVQQQLQRRLGSPVAQFTCCRRWHRTFFAGNSLAIKALGNHQCDDAEIFNWFALPRSDALEFL